MKKRVSNFSVHQTSKVMAIAYLVGSALICFPLAIYLTFLEGLTTQVMQLFAAPFIYFIVAYIGLALMLFIYNYVASIVGGIELTVTEEEVQTGKPVGPEQ